MILSHLQFCWQDYLAALVDPGTVGNTAQGQDYVALLRDTGMVGNTAQE